MRTAAVPSAGTHASPNLNELNRTSDCGEGAARSALRPNSAVYAVHSCGYGWMLLRSTGKYRAELAGSPGTVSTVSTLVAGKGEGY